MTATPLDLLSLDATAMLSLQASGAITAVELLDAHVALMAKLNPTLNAVVDEDIVAARAVATAIDDRRARGERLGALAGVVMTIKDAFDVAGLRTSQGRLSDAHLASVDAPTVARLRAADAVLLGKTNVPVFLGDHQAVNADFGQTANPWDIDRTPGGSSGGSAAAVAAGFSAGELGSDLTGSIRVPAAWCGLFAHRPSNGVISKRGHLPWPTDTVLDPPNSTAGPMARSAADVALLFEVMADLNEPGTPGWQLALPQTRITTLAGTRVGLWIDDAAAPIDAETRAAITGFAEALSAAGCSVVPLGADSGISVPVGGQDSLDLFDRLQSAEIAFSLGEEAWAATRKLAAEASAAPNVLTARLLTQTARAALHDLEEQRRIGVAWAAVFDTVDVILCPATPYTAPLHSSVPRSERVGHIDGREVPAEAVGAWSKLTNIGRGPATVIPLGLGESSGLPVGAQLLGAYLDDRTPLRVATLLEDAGLVGFVRPPFAGQH